MKASDILTWIVNDSVNGEFLGKIHVPDNGEESWEQNESWWLETFGGLPPKPIPSGTYLYYYESSIATFIHTTEQSFAPDAQIELSEQNGFDYIFLYKID